MMCVNNQSKMRVYDIFFDGAKPQRIIPQDVGDNIMFFPMPCGGVEVYLRDVQDGSRTKLLYEPYWRNRIYAI